METSSIIDIARKAGVAILEIYNDPQLANVVDYKDDNSPLTLLEESMSFPEIKKTTSNDIKVYNT